MLSYFSRQKTAANKWEHSSAGRASALQAEGHRFEPYCSHHYGLVVQLVRTLACHARGRRFDPDPGRQFASVAQSVEQGTENPRVIGSIPIGGTINADVAHPVERHLAKVEVASSSLVTRSNFIWYRGQVVRQRSAKPSFPSSNLGGTSKEKFWLIFQTGLFYLFFYMKTG